MTDGLVHEGLLFGTEVNLDDFFNAAASKDGWGTDKVAADR